MDAQGEGTPEVLAGLTEGRIVHFVMSNGEHRPAIVVRVWRVDVGGGLKRIPSNGLCNLQVFTDRINDGYDESVRWETSVEFNPDGSTRTWHWPEPAV